MNHITKLVFFLGPQSETEERVNECQTSEKGKELKEKKQLLVLLLCQQNYYLCVFRLIDFPQDSSYRNFHLLSSFVDVANISLFVKTYLTYRLTISIMSLDFFFLHQNGSLTLT